MPQDYDAVFAENFDPVLRFVLARIDAHTARDVTADVFVTAWRHLDELPDPPLGWLITVARRRVIDQYRAAGRRDALAASLAFVPGVDHVEPDPAEDVAGRDSVRRAFAALALADQEVLRLVAWDGLDHGAAAEALGCTPGGFAVRLHRARRRLRARLAGHPEPSSTFQDVTT